MGAKIIVRGKRAEGGKKFLGLYSGKNYLVFQLHNALIYMFPTFRTKNEEKNAFGSG